MSLPEPEPGLVIRYSYLWKAESDLGREEGVKDRPCAIILRVDESGEDTIVTVVPITHSPPANMRGAIEMPQMVKRRLGLDAEQSWFVLTEGNEFVWPGPDLRPPPGKDIASVAYGFLPPALFNAILARFIALAKAGLAARVRRTQ